MTSTTGVVGEEDARRTTMAIAMKKCSMRNGVGGEEKRITTIMMMITMILAGPGVSERAGIAAAIGRELITIIDGKEIGVAEGQMTRIPTAVRRGDET